MIVKYEIKRVFAKRLNRFLLGVAFAAAIVMSVFALTGARYVDSAGIRHETPDAVRKVTADRNKWKGELTGEVLAQVTGDWQETVNQYGMDVPNDVYGQKIQSYEDIQYMINSILCGDGGYDDNAILNISPEQAKNLYAVREEKIGEVIRKYGDTKEKQEFLESQYEKTKTPFYYEAADSFKNMLIYATTYGLILVVLIGFLAAGIFADEFTFRADAVFFSSRYGRTKALRSKILSGLLMATVIYWSGMALLSLICFTVMGVGGFGTPYQIEYPYSIYQLTCGQEYLILLLGGYVASLLSASVSMLAAAKTHSANIAVCLPFLLFCVSPFIGRALPFDTFFLLTPDQLTNIMNALKYTEIFQIGGIVFRQIPFILLFYTIVAAVLLPVIYQCCRRYRK